MVRLRVHSLTAGATVIDSRDGSRLGQTPLEKLVQQSRSSIPIMLWLAGYKDEAVTLALDADVSAVVTSTTLLQRGHLSSRTACRTRASSLPQLQRRSPSGA
jgi:hypothetical protein